ncbi:MAG: Flp pilus assembly protein CpaB [Coriobacteriales bacterium]|jgi:pilus assembly protein CpaB|nr:Flp pilus assembly protein CpaB [Coriobacteriales bacterium]
MKVLDIFQNKRILVALICGVLAAVLVAVYLSGAASRASASRAGALAAYGGEQVDVLVATRDIMAGETLDAGNTETQTWVADLLPQGAICDPGDAHGKSLAVPLLKNEPVVTAKLGEAAQPIAVPDGLVALSIPVEDVSAVGGAVASGSAVNVYAVGATTVSLVVQDVLVLETSNGYGMSKQPASGSGQKGSGGLFGASPTRTTLKWVTLAVSPGMVQELLATSRDKNIAIVLPGKDADVDASDLLSKATKEGERNDV